MKRTIKHRIWKTRRCNPFHKYIPNMFHSTRIVESTVISKINPCFILARYGITIEKKSSNEGIHLHQNNLCQPNCNKYKLQQIQVSYKEIYSSGSFWHHEWNWYLHKCIAEIASVGIGFAIGGTMGHVLLGARKSGKASAINLGREQWVLTSLG